MEAKANAEVAVLASRKLNFCRDFAIKKFEFAPRKKWQLLLFGFKRYVTENLVYSENNQKEVAKCRDSKLG